MIYLDGASNNEENRARLILIVPNGQRIKYALHLQFPATNNVIQYEVLILSLELVREVGAQVVNVFSDSQLLVRQVNGRYKAKE